MDAQDFDRVARVAATRLPRRALAGLFGLSSLGVISHAQAKKKHKKVKRNSFGCVNVGKYCKNDGQCCSGICSGKKRKHKCKPHDERTCQSGQDFCHSVTTPCTTSADFEGLCAITTGKASYCFSDGGCFPCVKDKDCEPTFGTGAACVICADCLGETPTGTFCAGLAAAL